jgi:DNA-binding transcriptional MerR regulator
MERVSSVQMSELADSAGVPVATVKYYLRAGLLPAGQVAGPRRAVYDDSHLRRLRILRILREVGGIPVTALQQIVDAVDDGSRSEHEVLCLVADALTPTLLDVPSGGHSRDLVDAALDGVGWTSVRPDAADRIRLEALIQLVSGQETLTVDQDILDYYTRLTDELCRTERRLIDTAKDRAGTLEDMIAGEVAFGEMLALLRRMGHEHYHAVARLEAVPD